MLAGMLRKTLFLEQMSTFSWFFTGLSGKKDVLKEVKVGDYHLVSMDTIVPSYSRGCIDS
jgi:hypothetical protein